MAGSAFVPLIGPSYHLADRKAAVQSAVNCYPQRLSGDDWMMTNTPGEVQIAAMGAEIRGSRDVEGRWFVVAGNTLYEVTAAGTTTSRGTLSTSTGFVGMAHNTSQLALVDGPTLYVLTLGTNVFTTVVSSGWRGSADVWELDGYMIFVDQGTQQFYISAIDDATNLNALDFSSADAAPDNIITHRVSHRQLWLFGSYTTEIWIDSGALAFPFARYPSYVLDVGIVGERAAIIAADTLFWVGQTRGGRGIVYMAGGNQPQRVSTMAIEQALSASSDLTQATMWAYQVEGHEFIAINAPGMPTTLVYDAALQQWHERGEWSDGWQPLRSRLLTAYKGNIYGGDVYGSLVRLDSSANTLNGRPLVRERTWPHMLKPSMEPINFRCVEVSMKSGYGGNVTLEISNDGGYTFGPPLIRSLGAVGRWLQRVRWNGLGSALNRVFRLRCSDAVPFGIYGAAVDAS